MVRRRSPDKEGLGVCPLLNQRGRGREKNIPKLRILLHQKKINFEGIRNSKINYHSLGPKIMLIVAKRILALNFIT